MICDQRRRAFTEWEVFLAAPIFGFFHWLSLSGFRRFRDEGVTPRCVFRLLVDPSRGAD